MIIFYEKSGCKSNAKQKSLLVDAGHALQVRDLRDHEWKPVELRAFFGDLPVEKWFNKTAPDVKSGKIDITRITEYDAIMLMVQNPLLIRRPLMETNFALGCGFDAETLDRLGLSDIIAETNMEGCSNIHGHTCADLHEVTP
jgi:nitrogenase-associated protein